jgi:hypothetical protein
VVEERANLDYGRHDTNDESGTFDAANAVETPDALDSPVELDTGERKSDLGVAEIDDVESNEPSTYGSP